MGTACEHSYVARTVTFPQPTDATNDMLRAIREEVGALFIPGARYRKSGVVFFGLERAGAPRQGDLFAAAEPTRPSKLYKAVDALNARYGRGKVFSAAEGIAKPWKMKRGKLSPRATTNWNELLVVG